MSRTRSKPCHTKLRGYKSTYVDEGQVFSPRQHHGMLKSATKRSNEDHISRRKRNASLSLRKFWISASKDIGPYCRMPSFVNGKDSGYPHWAWFPNGTVVLTLSWTIVFPASTKTLCLWCPKKRCNSDAPFNASCQRLYTPTNVSALFTWPK